MDLYDRVSLSGPESLSDRHDRDILRLAEGCHFQTRANGWVHSLSMLRVLLRLSSRNNKADGQSRIGRNLHSSLVILLREEYWLSQSQLH
jgi:hypothetical protein